MRRGGELMDHYQIRDMSSEIGRRVLEWRERDREIRAQLNIMLSEVEQLIARTEQVDDCEGEFDSEPTKLG